MYRTVSSRFAVCSQCLLSQRRSLITVRRSASAAAADFRPVSYDSPNASIDDKTVRDIFDSADAWRSFSSRSRDPHIPGRGLFLNQFLSSIAGFNDYAIRAEQKTKRLVARMSSAQSSEQLVTVVHELDRISDQLCRVIDACDLVRTVHPDSRFVAAAVKAQEQVYDYMNVLNTTPGLYYALKRALETPEVVAQWSEEERTVARILYRDFEKSGIFLPEKARQKFVGLSSEISQLEQKFVDEVRTQHTELAISISDLKGMDPTIIKRLRVNGRAILPIGVESAHALKTVHNETTRKAIWAASQTAHPSQLETLSELVLRRQQLAQLVGKKTFCEVALADKMARTPEAVSNFLESLAEANKPLAQQELDGLAAIKGMETGNEKYPALNPWDRDYYMQKTMNNLRSRTKGSDILDSYFSLGTVMQGLSRLFTRLYGVRFVPRETEPGETWHPDVRRLDVVSESEGHIAVMYCDLFARYQRRGNPSHYTVRCSRRITEEELAEEFEEGIAPNDGMAVARRVSDSNALYQLPTIVLICDFERANVGCPPLLLFREMQTLFHEMGHAVHSILGRTALHNVSGTRCATDWSELPSVLMEHFAKDLRVLNIFARHWKTDAPLPAELFVARLHHDSLFEATETRAQIIFALLDLHLHAGSTPAIADTQTIAASLEERYSLFPSISTKASWQGLFWHLSGYGGMYYAYLFDRAIAARIWDDLFRGDPLSRVNGDLLASEVLKWGGARDGWTCLAGVLGREDLKDGGESAMEQVGRWGSALK